MTARGTSALAVEIVATFDANAGEHPENVAVAPDGAIYVTLHAAGTVWRRTPDGATARLALPLPVAPEDATRVNGIVVGADGTATVAVRADDPALAGLWAFAPGATTAEKTADLPPHTGLNGMAMDARGNRYIADDTLGVIWRIAPGARRATVWHYDALLTPDAAGAPYPWAPVYGANGIKVFGAAVYVSNPSRAAIARIPILPDGAAGALDLPYPGVAFPHVDDFAFDALGNCTITTVVSNTVERVAPDGTRAALLTAADGLDLPTAVAFGPGADGGTALYVTNAAFFSTPGATPRASLLRLPVAVPGYPLAR